MKVKAVLMKKLLALMLLCGVFFSACATNEKPQGVKQPSPEIQKGYVTTTLRDPIFPPTRVNDETAIFNTLLTSYYPSITSCKQASMQREYLYALIDSKVKNIYSSTGTIFPSESDEILEKLFSWSEKLCVYGGSLVYNRLRPSSSPEMPMLMKPPKGISINLVDDLFDVKSSEGRWSFTVPYYFMIWGMSDSVLANGLRSQVIMLSTGTARDKVTRIGFSQATLMLVFSPGAELEPFADSWRKVIGFTVSNSEEQELGIRGLRSQNYLDTNTNIHHEFVSWNTKQGVFAVSYSGLAGTYEWNRQHFLDFLRALKIE
ncbi:MAG: hypothetical protein WC836_14850 [Desulfobacula sp.]|jgi:hypothetical protein